MEPPSENRPTVETARELGRQKIDKVLNFIAPVFAPGVLLEVGANAIKDRAEALKLRVETKALEIRNSAIEKLSAAYDRFENRFTTAKDKTTAVAKEIGRRAAVVGLTPIAAGEAVWAEIYKTPALFRESIADMKEKKADKYEAFVRELRRSGGEHREKAADRRERARKKTVARTALDRVKAAA